MVHGRPADDAVTGATGRTQEDQQIDEACAPRMALGVDHYAACVAEKGREALPGREDRLRNLDALAEVRPLAAGERPAVRDRPPRVRGVRLG